MKTKNLSVCVGTLLIGAALLSSCSYKIYPKSTLEFNYDVNMTTAKELKAKSNVQIYLSEAEVPYDYETLAFVRYSPAIVLPILAPERPQQLKKFYKKAVLKAQELGGNGVIINTVGNFRVIDIPELKEVEAAEAPAFSPIMNSAVLDKFEDGSIFSAEDKQKTKYITMLEDEIKSNLKACKTMEEADFIGKKIDALRNYYDKVGKISKGMDKTIEGYRTALQAAVKKIEAKATRAGQRAAQAADRANGAANNAKGKAKGLFQK